MVFFGETFALAALAAGVWASEWDKEELRAPPSRKHYIPPPHLPKQEAEENGRIT